MQFRHMVYMTEQLNVLPIYNFYDRVYRRFTWPLSLWLWFI